MESQTIQLAIGGMTCVSCQNKIERTLNKTNGVLQVSVGYRDGTAHISYEPEKISHKEIATIIEQLGYSVLLHKKTRESPFSRVSGILILVVSLYVLLQQFGVLNLLVPSQLADSNMGYGMLFFIGLLTSIHCIAMCGGINLSQCIPKQDELATKRGSIPAAVLYNLGRVISYTSIGFLLGFVGLLFGGDSSTGLPVMVQGMLKLVAGVFMVIMGINMLGLFPWLRALQPRMPALFARKIEQEKHNRRSPLFIGLLNGLMPCGPLQSMQIVALASGNPMVGGLSMLLFSLGTVPLMFGFGTLVSVLGKKFTHSVMNVGAVLVVVLGLAMLSQGGSLSGLLPPDRLLAVILLLSALAILSSIPFHKPSHRTVSLLATMLVALTVFVTWSNVADGGKIPDVTSQATIVDGKQLVTSTLSSRTYPKITVQAGVPVKWVIYASEDQINGCNNTMNVSEYGINEYSLQAGENVIEFTPDKVGTFPYSCWMGMIRGSITVT